MSVRVAHGWGLESQRKRVGDMEPVSQALPLGELAFLPQGSSLGLPPISPPPPLIPRWSRDTGVRFYFILGLGSACFPGRIEASCL